MNQWINGWINEYCITKNKTILFITIKQYCLPASFTNNAYKVINV